jgi:hypothetical protein
LQAQLLQYALCSGKSGGNVYKALYIGGDIEATAGEVVEDILRESGSSIAGCGPRRWTEAVRSLAFANSLQKFCRLVLHISRLLEFFFRLLKNLIRTFGSNTTNLHKFNSLF